MQTINLYNNLFETIKTRLNKAYNPISLYIFGSYAWGTPTKDSDLDLLLVVESSDKKPYHINALLMV